LLNPKDAAHPKADETMFVLATAGEYWQVDNTYYGGVEDVRRVFKGLYQDMTDFTRDLLPQIILAQKNGWFGNHKWDKFPPRPSLDSLLSLPENDPGKLSLFAYPISEAEKAGWGKNNPILEWKFGDNEALPPELQKILLPLSFTIK
jgi:hypothetical protein